MTARPMVLVLLALLVTPAGGAGSGRDQRCDNSYPALVPYRATIMEGIEGSSLAGDGAAYTHDHGACLYVAQDPRGFLQFAHPAAPQWPECRNRMTRTFRMDLGRPVPGEGGIDRGSLLVRRPHLQVHTRVDSAGTLVGLQGMQVGETSPARYLVVSATDHQLRLHFNPTYTGCPAWIVLAPGSTHGTVTRTSATQWEIDLPEGSRGRLLEGPEGTVRQDRGLYFFRARILIETL